MADRPRGDEDVQAGLAFAGVVVGVVGYWWWSLGDAGRLQWLGPVAEGSGYEAPPLGMLEQIEWLMTNRARDLEGMFMVLLVAAAAGFMEGSAKRQAALLSGFGLRRLKTGRALLVIWLLGLLGSVLAPLPLPYAGMAGGLSALLFASAFTMALGRRRAH
ncbi:MAG: hypothetical protein OXP66_18635 [Candidatus Tectomicrobia bacterium]|nr:hypothetical protein [Candidatus Tectomicrobia bacterium]